MAGAYGVRGEIRLKSFCADPAAIADYAPLVDDHGRARGLRLIGPVKGGFAARLEGVATREEAEALKGLGLHAPRERLPALPDDEFYHADLVGLAAVDAGGAPFGRIVAIHDFGAGDVLELAGPPLPRPVMLPFTREIAPTVDLAAGRVVVDPPPGALPWETPEDDGEAPDAEGFSEGDPEAGPEREPPR